jgi:hypothetical protein
LPLPTPRSGFDYGSEFIDLIFQSTASLFAQAARDHPLQLFFEFL